MEKTKNTNMQIAILQSMLKSGLKSGCTPTARLIPSHSAPHCGPYETGSKSGLKFQLGSPHHIFGPNLWSSESVVVSGLVAVVNALVAGFSVLVARISGQVAEVSRLGARVSGLVVGVR